MNNLVMFRLPHDVFAKLERISKAEGNSPSLLAKEIVTSIVQTWEDTPEQAPVPVAASTAPAPVPVPMPANIGMAKKASGNDEPSLQCPKCVFRCVTRAAMTYHYEKAHPELLKASVEASP